MLRKTPSNRVVLLALTTALLFGYIQQAPLNLLDKSRVIWSIGDSITAGTIHYNPTQPTSPKNLITNAYQYWLDYYLNSNASALTSSRISVYNKGVPSNTCAQVDHRFDTDVGNDSIVILMCGINDFASRRTVAQVEGSITNISKKAMAKNDSLVIMEVIPDGNGLYCASIVPFNSWLSINFFGNPNVMIVKMHSQMSNGIDCYYNPSLYESDGVHPNINGYGKMAQFLWIRAFGEQKYSNLG